MSLRVTPEMKRSIEKRSRPDLMQLVPAAVKQVGGFAESCHQFAAGSTIPEERVYDLLRLLAERAATQKEVNPHTRRGVP